MDDNNIPKTVPNWIAGVESEAVSRETFGKVSPHSGEELCRVARSNDKDVKTAIQAGDNPNALYQIPKTLGDNEMNIDYCYSTLVKDDSMLIVRVEDDIIEEAVKILQKNGFKITV